MIEVLSFSEEHLAEAFSNQYLGPSDIRNKNQFQYFLGYLGKKEGLGAHTIVIEKDYVSRSYLQDYSNYYSLCFKDYSRSCKRVHFFSTSFDEEGFKEAVLNKASQDVLTGYLGYTVIKPLPVNLFGATILKTYQSTGSKARYYITKPYEVNLFGNKILLDSLAFQEQDTVVSACATSALWCAFHKTSELFQTPLPTPSEITLSAKNLFHETGRNFPNEGLDHYQIGNAIEAVNLVFELRTRIDTNNWLKAFSYAYMRAGLPVLFGICFRNTYERHLITVTGYRKNIPEKNTFSGKPARQYHSMALTAFDIERFYAHDDQIGPFSRLGVSGENTIETGWYDQGKPLQASVISVIVPLHPKIRINFEDVYSEAMRFDGIFEAFIANFYNFLCWDIYLDFSNNYKEEVREDSDYSEDLKKHLLFKNFPRYIWVARAYIQENKIFELLFDATDISKGMFCLRINIINSDIEELFQGILEVENNRTWLKENFGAQYIDLLEWACK